MMEVTRGKRSVKARLQRVARGARNRADGLRVEPLHGGERIDPHRERQPRDGVQAEGEPEARELAPADVQPTVNSSSVDEEAEAKAARKAKKAEKKKKAKKTKTDDQAEAVAEQLFQAEQQQKEEKAKLARERECVTPRSLR